MLVLLVQGRIQARERIKSGRITPIQRCLRDLRLIIPHIDNFFLLSSTSYNKQDFLGFIKLYQIENRREIIRFYLPGVNESLGGIQNSEEERLDGENLGEGGEEEKKAVSIQKRK